VYSYNDCFHGKAVNINSVKKYETAYVWHIIYCMESACFSPSHGHHQAFHRNQVIKCCMCDGIPTKLTDGENTLHLTSLLHKIGITVLNYRISRPIRRTFFPRKMWPKFDLHLTRRGYYFQTYKYRVKTTMKMILLAVTTIFWVSVMNKLYYGLVDFKLSPCCEYNV
jgi:hypothetical protein